MEIEKIKIENLLEYKNNAKEHPQWQIDQIVKSIEEFGSTLIERIRKDVKNGN